MSAVRQLDMFAALPPTFPPWADPAKVGEVHVSREEDRDHVGQADIGRLGNNREIWVVTVEDNAGEVLRSENFDGERAAENAWARQEAIWALVQSNRQQLLSL